MEWAGNSTTTAEPIFSLNFPPIGDLYRGPMPLISNAATTMGIFSLNIIGISLLSVGIFANIVNVVVFAKQGFIDSINVSLTSLTVSDLACLIHMLWQTVALFPAVEKTSLPFSPREVSIVTGSIPRVYFSRVSSLITVYISVERCISVIKPLKVKFLFTRKRLVTSMICMYVFNALPIIITVNTTRLAWKWHPLRNRTYLGVVILKGGKFLDNLGIGLGVLIAFSTFIIVAVCAIILVWTLVKHNRWRNIASTTTVTPSVDETEDKDSTGKGTTKNKKKQRPNVSVTITTPGSNPGSGNKTGSSMSNRDKRAARTVMFLATMFVLCYFPGVLCQIAMLVVPEFSRGGPYRNAYSLFWLISLRAEGLCASANILVYFKTSTKYRETLLQTFCINLKKTTS